MKSPLYVSVIVLTVLTATACDSDGVDPTPSTWMAGKITGALSTDYQGTGDFFVNADAFGLYSTGVVERTQSVFLWRNSRGGPRVGDYSIVCPAHDVSEWPAFAATYQRVIGDISEHLCRCAGMYQLQK